MPLNARTQRSQHRRARNDLFPLSGPAVLLPAGTAPAPGVVVRTHRPEARFDSPAAQLVRNLSRSRQSRAGRLLFGLRLLGLAALIAALARPQTGEMNDSTEAEGIDIVLTLDLSGSMRALDPSTREQVVTRLDAAKKVVQAFIDQRPYDRIGLVAFAEDAFVVSPLTLNHDWLKKNIQRLELGDIRSSGTAIGTALGASATACAITARSRIVVLLTDGENNSGALSPIGAAEAAKAYGVKVYTIATGRQGRVPVPASTQDGRVVRDAEGKPSIADTTPTTMNPSSRKSPA